MSWPASSRLLVRTKKCLLSIMLCHGHSAGSRLASFPLSRAALSAVLVACSGCLVTSTYEIPDPTNVPPIIQDDPASIAKIGSTIWLDSETPQGTFRVRVRDEDTEQVLDARWRLVQQGVPLPAFTSLPPLPAGPLVRPLDFSVAGTQLSDGKCHQLELAVSGNFWKDAFGEDRTDPIYFAEVTPEFEDDLALATWQIWEGKGSTQTTDDEKVRLLDSCNAKELPPPSSLEAPP
jgi:hypothetical protein